MNLSMETLLEILWNGLERYLLVTFLYLGVWSNWHEWGKCQFVTVPWIGSFYFFGFSIIMKLQMVKYKCSFMIQR